MTGWWKKVFHLCFLKPHGGVEVVKIVETPFIPNDRDESLEITDSVEQSTVVLSLTEESLLEAWRRFVSSQKRGSFQTVLRRWVTARLEMNCPVNPGPEDVDLPRAQAPNQEFTSKLQTAFEEVRSKQRKR